MFGSPKSAASCESPDCDYNTDRTMRRPVGQGVAWRGVKEANRQITT